MSTKARILAIHMLKKKEKNPIYFKDIGVDINFYKKALNNQRKTNEERKYMREKNLRKKDILSLIEGLDISPTMYKNATDKYKAVASYLQEQGLECEIFPQGSFSLGTVIRPYKESKEAAYDLDFLCCINKEKNHTTPEYIKNIVKDKLWNSPIYKDLLQEEWDKCWTLEYAKINNLGFNIDIVPGVSEDDNVIGELNNMGLPLELAELSTAITNKLNEDYMWITNNAKAYKIWFDKINKNYLENQSHSRRQKLFESYSKFYNSIEEIPMEMERSSLQRVIQILKHHRDIYFCTIKQEELKPTSAIITTICAEIASEKDPSLDVFELLQEIVSDFEIYSKHQVLNESEFAEMYMSKKIIQRNNLKWEIINPVNPKDNLADSWNQGNKKAEMFFKWVKKLKDDYINSLVLDDDKFVALLENNFGKDYVNKSLDLSKYVRNEPKPLINTPKPWSCDV